MFLLGFVFTAYVTVYYIITTMFDVCGTRSSMLAGLSCTKGVWYIYDWDTGSTILIW